MKVWEDIMRARNLDRRVAERYKLPEDIAKEGRFSRGYPVQPRRVSKAEIYDVSYSGVAFRISADLAPEIGELVAIEFKLPNGPRMAWYAQAMRLEVEHTSQNADHPAIIKVGAKFLEIPPLRRKQMERNIDSLLDDVHKDQSNRVHIFSQAMQVRRSHEITYWRWVRLSLLLAFSVAAALWFVHYMTSIGSTERMINRTPIWPGFKSNYLESPGIPTDLPQEPASDDPQDKR